MPQHCITDPDKPFTRVLEQRLRQTMTAGSEKFGAYIQRQREAREIGLREMAKKIGVSPPYLSKAQRDKYTPPTEEKVRAIALLIACNVDELLAMAGRMPSDLGEIIKRRPVDMSALLSVFEQARGAELQPPIPIEAGL